MNDLLKELIKRASILFLVLGVLLLLLAANGGFPIQGAKSFPEVWNILLGTVGGLLFVAGAAMAIIEWRATVAKPGEIKLAATSPAKSSLDQVSVQQLEYSGLTRAFRIPKDNTARLQRVCYLIEEEVDKGNGHLRLTASSGQSYLSPNGAVWKTAGIGSLIDSGKIKHLEVVLESPFSLFAETRALANNVSHNQWEEKQDVSHLMELLKYPNVDLRVTMESITCSLFFTSRAVYYDPYLWSLPDALGRTENNFWVFEFDKVTDPAHVKMECYGLLERHFEFLQMHSIALEKLLHRPEPGAKVPRKEQYLKLFAKSRETALNNYNALTTDFHQRMSKRLKEKQ